MTTFTYKRWSGSTETIEADRVTFEPSGHVVFWADNPEVWNVQPRIVLAERSEHVNQLRAVEED